jgi:hypothetical protein
VEEFPAELFSNWAKNYRSLVKEHHGTAIAQLVRRNLIDIIISGKNDLAGAGLSTG